MRKFAAILALGIALAAPSSAQATTTVLPNVVSASILTPAGDLPVQATTAVPAVATYVAPGTNQGFGTCDPQPANIGPECELVQFGSDGKGIPVGVAFAAPTAEQDRLVAIGGWGEVASVSIPVGSTSFTGLMTHAPIYHANYEIDEYQAQGDCFAGVPVAAIQFPWCGIRLYVVGPNGWDEDGSSTATFGTIRDAVTGVVLSPVGTFAVGAYTPAASVTGDPWFHFPNASR